MTDLLVTFLRARLDEDEQVARRACGYTSEVWRVDDDEETLLLWDPMPDTPGRGHTLGERITRHVARHDPARVLAEVEAVREVVRLAERAHDYAPTFMDGFASAMEGALRLFAQAYTDHPDYREEWRP